MLTTLLDNKSKGKGKSDDKGGKSEKSKGHKSSKSNESGKKSSKGSKGSGKHSHGSKGSSGKSSKSSKDSDASSGSSEETTEKDTTEEDTTPQTIEETTEEQTYIQDEAYGKRLQKSFENKPFDMSDVTPPVGMVSTIEGHIVPKATCALCYVDLQKTDLRLGILNSESKAGKRNRPNIRRLGV